MKTVSLDLWAVNLEPALPDLASWLARLEERLAASSHVGADMLVLPEFACAQWLSFAPLDLPAENSLAWLHDTGTYALEEMAKLSSAYSVSLLPGTIPFPVVPGDIAAGFYNRAWLLTPDGERHIQDKLSLTPLEAAGAGGKTVAGTSINVIHWKGLRIAVIICLDSEFTSLWSILGSMDLDLILIPAKTDMITGYNRVFGCARSRAVELQTVVCAIGAVGVPVGHPLTDTGVGGASVFVPCDVALSLDGVFATLPPQSGAMFTNTTLHVPGIPVGACRQLRHGSAEAEVCPAMWDASHITIVDADAK